MATDTLPEHKPLPLAIQILHAERRLLERRRSIIACAARLRRDARAQAASPAMLAGAAGLGFALERMIGRKPADAEPAGRASTDLFGTALKWSSFVRGLSNFIPS